MIIYPDHKEFYKFLCQFYKFLDWIPPNYGQINLCYYKDLTLSKGKIVDDKSFLFLLDEESVYGFLGAAVTSNSKTDLLAYEIPCVSLENKKNQNIKTTKFFLNEFDRVTDEVDGTIWYRDFMISNELSALSRHLMLKGASAKPVFFKVLDLSQNEAKLKNGIRKSYSSLINWGMRELQPIVLGADDLTWEHMLEFRQLHIKEAGRVTRSEESWRWQYKMVQAGEAFVVLGYQEHELVSAGFFTHSKKNCYYGSSASRRDLFKKPLSHALVWSAILHAKKIGCFWFGIGEQLFPNHPENQKPTKKELGISMFKAGFGGVTRMFLDLKLDKSLN